VVEQLVCGYPVWKATSTECRDELARRALAGEGGWVITLNLEMIARSSRDKSYDQLSHSADIFLADGMPIVWAARKKYPTDPMPERTAGSDLIIELIPEIPASQIAVIGGEDPIVGIRKLIGESAVQVYIFNGKVAANASEIQPFVDEFVARDTRMIFVALGVPKQDVVAKLIRDAYPKAILIGVGGSFELLAGQKKRAPEWMQKAGLEWAFRLLQEPKRLARRYLYEYWAGVFALRRDISRRPNR